MSIAEVRELMRKRHFDEAFEQVERLLKANNDCPLLWNLRGDLIQLGESANGPSLEEAGKSYAKAHQLNPHGLEAMESLAHYYDVIEQNPAKAKKYAKAYLAQAKKGIAAMEKIISGE